MVNDQPDVPIYTNRRKVVVLRLFQLVELQTRMRRVQLQIEGRGLNGLLLIAGELGEAVGKRVGDTEFHVQTSESVHRRKLMLSPSTTMWL